MIYLQRHAATTFCYGSCFWFPFKHAYTSTSHQHSHLPASASAAAALTSERRISTSCRIQNLPQCNHNCDHRSSTRTTFPTATIEIKSTVVEMSPQHPPKKPPTHPHPPHPTNLCPSDENNFTNSSTKQSTKHNTSHRHSNSQPYSYFTSYTLQFWHSTLSSFPFNLYPMIRDGSNPSAWIH